MRAFLVPPYSLSPSTSLNCRIFLIKVMYFFPLLQTQLIRRQAVGLHGLSRGSYAFIQVVVTKRLTFQRLHQMHGHQHQSYKVLSLILLTWLAFQQIVKQHCICLTTMHWFSISLMQNHRSKSLYTIYPIAWPAQISHPDPWSQDVSASYSFWNTCNTSM